MPRHIIRAALESTAFQTFEVLEAMRKDLPSNSVNSSVMNLKVDGGMTENNLLMQVIFI